MQFAQHGLKHNEKFEYQNDFDQWKRISGIKNT